MGLWYGDVCGPISPSTPAGNMFFLLIVDDYNRFMWLVMIKRKDQVFSAFKEVLTSMEVEKNKSLKVFRTDRGGEFKSNELEEFCKVKGIQRQMSAPYSLQQNGVVE